jgi:ribosome-interacting GTPase 1
MPTAPRTPAEHHYEIAESGLADLGRVGFDDAGRTVEVLVALTHATLAIAAILADEDNHGRL